MIENNSSNQTKKTTENHVRIGFASNHSRQKDFRLIESVLVDTLNKYPNCELDIIGVPSKRLSKHKQVNLFGHKNNYKKYVNFQLSRKWDIGLAPLRKTTQNEAKTNNKFREYAAMSIPGIYQNMAPYFEVINGVNGFLADQKAKSWKKALELLIESKELRTQIQQNAFTEVKSKYDLTKVMVHWLEEMNYYISNQMHKPISWNKKTFESTESIVYIVWYVFRTHKPLKAFNYFGNRFMFKLLNSFSE